MAQEIQMPNEGQRKAFIEKLGQFRGTLTPDEQRMLDIMAVTTFQPREAHDVQGYTWYWGAAGPYGPGWYETGWRWTWDNTPYRDTAYGLTAGPDGRYLP
jgi:hypothetical protein